MPDVKPRRPYRSDRRQEQAAATRRSILRSARRLFVERGYAGTTVEAVAEGAGVAAVTVYSAFGGKRQLLDRLIDESIVGDDAPVPLLEREGPQAMLREPDQRRQLAMLADGIAAIMERLSPVYEVMRNAAPGEPSVDARLQGFLANRLGGMRFVVDGLARNGPLRDGLSAEQAAATVWALSSPDLHRLLTGRLGWPRDRYVAWLRETLAAALLPDRARSRPPRARPRGS